MALLHHQLPDLHWQTKQKIDKMALFVVFVYLKSWFNAPSLTSAAENDLNLYKSLQKFKNVHKKVSSSTSTVLNRHTWYLTEELIPLSLFDDKRTLLATKIGQLTPGGTKVCKPTLPTISLKSELADFVGERSTTQLQPEYHSVKTSLKNLSPLNDACERALGLVTRFNTHITRNEESFQELIQVVEEHRKRYSLKTKKALKTFYQLFCVLLCDILYFIYKFEIRLLVQFNARF